MGDLFLANFSFSFFIFSLSHMFWWCPMYFLKYTFITVWNWTPRRCLKQWSSSPSVLVRGTSTGPCIMEKRGVIMVTEQLLKYSLLLHSLSTFYNCNSRKLSNVRSKLLIMPDLSQQNVIFVVNDCKISPRVIFTTS